MRQRGAIAAGAVILVSSACAHGPRQAVTVPPNPGRVAAQVDATTAAIAVADQSLALGLSELQVGHMNQAREAFDRATDQYLSYPGGAYANPRLAEAYRRTVETIHLRDIESLAAGDGFAEAESEPASIDDVGQIAVDEQPASPETRRVAEAAVETEQNDLPIELNDRVLACIDLYQGRLQTWFASALARGGRYLPYIRKVFAEEGLPQDLAYTALVESAFKTSALSRAKARGVWQFIPATGKRFGLQQDWWVDERGDPEKATRAAAQYLKQLYAQFGDWNLALAGYNAGENKIQRGLNRYGVSDFWALARTSGIRRETKNYVPMIHAAIVVAKAPERYGFSVQPEPELTYDRVTVAGAYDLRTIAECAACSLDELRGLNPELRRFATPARKDFPLKVPAGRGGDAQRCLSALPSEKRVSFRTHVVARGQTLATIARRYGARVEDIAQANGMVSSRRLARGTELIIPMPPAAARAAARVSPPAARATASHGVESSQLAKVSYRIRPGDTLGSIADRYGVSVDEIRTWNGLSSSRIAAGRLLKLFPHR